jgi:(1->4)-alpha-D-glucan 1-alpha-D-glucosylmutase
VRPTRRIGATYRLQMAGLSFRRAAGLVPYLSSFGIETLYLSPVLRAREASAHGYDVVNPSELDPARGTRQDFDNLLSTLDATGMNLLLDIVPNHLAASEENPIWTEVLASGRKGERGGFFDIDWDVADGLVHLPVLGRPLAEAIAEREIGLAVRDAKLVVTYFDRCFPVARGTAPDAMAFVESFEALDDASAQAVLSEVLSAQNYRLAYWRSAVDDVDYRRFFDIDDLVGVRIEDPAVYEETHRFVLELARDRRIGGLRVDHVDGLADPAGYLERLSADLRLANPAPVVLVEKILAADEHLEPDWQTEGTTGYEFAALAVACSSIPPAPRRSRPSWRGSRTTSARSPNV